MAKFSKKFTIRLFYTLLLLLGLFVILLIILEQDLPDVESLKDVQLQVPLRVYTADHELIAEFGEMRRMPLQMSDVPPQLINAIIATEDRRFWEHSGVDMIGLARATVLLVTTGEKSQGGSTITMQVARNFFLSSKKTYIRKLREILLALKIDHALDKQTILNLYLNKIYLGYRAYGFGAAARVYYGKPLNQLTLAELAVLAGLPKAPSAINPLTNPDAAKDRRNHVLLNMYEQNYITKAEYDQAVNAPITASYHQLPLQIEAPYVAEMVRNAMVQQYGDAAYTKGLVVTTTINSRLQAAANAAVHQALLDYTQRHGYHGPITNIGTADRQTALIKLNDMPTVGNLVPAVVTSVDAQSATALLRGGQSATIPWQGIQWAGKALIKGWKSAAPTNAGQVMKVGDVVYLNQISGDQWALSEIPQLQGALVSLNPVNGAISALVGGFDFHYSKFNRITDALRQPGSAFKPFLYSAALDKGYTLASIVNDAPIVTASEGEDSLWRPENDNLTFGGPTRLRVALMKSRNLVSIRLLQLIGIPYATQYIEHLGFDPQPLPDNLSMALGTGVLTPMQLTTGFAIFANGGYRITPYFIQSVVDSGQDDKVLFQANPPVACETCVDGNEPQPEPNTTTQYAPRVVNPQNAYLITSAMQSVIQGGTGSAARVLGRSDLAGKTGTTNDWVDAWFAGFNSDIVTVCWVGFDQPRSIYEYGAGAALPMWIDFMRQALKGMPTHTMPRPPGLVTVKIDPQTGLLARPGQPDAIFETFPQEYVPTTKAPAAAASQNDLLTAAPTNNNSAPAAPANPAPVPVPNNNAPQNPPLSADGSPDENPNDGSPDDNSDDDNASDGSPPDNSNDNNNSDDGQPLY